MAKKREVTSAKRLAAEGGIASEERAAVELEIEANEGPVEEPRKKPAERAAVRGESGETGCPIRMGTSGHKCGRKFHIAPDEVDKRPVCLMHSRDPRKLSGPLFDTFWLEFERILADAREGEAHFDLFVFPKLDLSKRKFQAICHFDCASFTQKADFRSTTFTRNASFLGATFTQKAYFRETTFTQDANFLSATFMQDADFHEATLMQYANFFMATFAQAVRFVETKFRGAADWRGSRFLDQAEFRGTKFESAVEGHPSAGFALASFSKPGEIVFDDVDLSRVLFHNCDVSQVWFTSSVNWRKREGNRGLVVFEERLLLDQELEKELKRDGERDYRAVAQIYQQLKKNYDSRLDYWTANEFHYGEMEMKRLAGPTDGRLLWLRQWWHRNFSFMSWYKYASDYGNSYGKPLAWLLFFILFFFPALYPLPGLMRQGAMHAETYATNWNIQKGYGENLWAKRDLIGNSVIASLDVATFQRNPEYAPAHPWGRVVAIVETLLTSSLFALFLLAIRRQFRR